MSPTPLAAPAAVGPAPKISPTIEVENLSKVYGVRRVVDSISFSVAQGEILGLLGPNGAGKTTAMRILTCYTPATAGRASIAGHDVSRDPLGARRNLGYLPENAPVYRSMTVRDYLGFISEIKRHASRMRRTYVNRAIDECALEDVADRLIANLSKGFRQRVALAQAILGDPSVLILDEPTVGLDPRQISDIRSRIKQMAGSRTVLLSTHILPEVSMICQKVLIIDRGRIVASGTPDKLVSTVKKDSAISVTVEGDLGQARDLLRRIPGVEDVHVDRTLGARSAQFRLKVAAGADPRKQVARELAAAGIDLIEIGMNEATLEDLFLQVISSEEGSR